MFKVWIPHLELQHSKLIYQVGKVASSRASQYGTWLPLEVVTLTEKVLMHFTK